MVLNEINTTSALISFARSLEEKSSQFYQELAQKFPGEKNIFQLFAKENKNFINSIVSTYYSIISDAFEGCFAFNINRDKFELKVDLTQKTNYTEAIILAIEMESKMIDFYCEAGEQSNSLLADIPLVFSSIKKKRVSRIQVLNSLANEPKAHEISSV